MTFRISEQGGAHIPQPNLDDLGVFPQKSKERYAWITFTSPVAVGSTASRHFTTEIRRATRFHTESRTREEVGYPV